MVVESYGRYQNDQLLVYYDAGISYLINPDIQVDLVAGYGDNKVRATGLETASSYASVGVSYRIHDRNN